MAKKTALAFRHVHFENLGCLADVLTRQGYDWRLLDAGQDDLATVDALAPDLLIVLGGPIGVYEEEDYPFLTTEISVLRERLAANLPTLGICLGAQLIARALGAAVYPSGIKEIGFEPLILTETGQAGPLAHLRDVAVLHWHGDTFDLPVGAAHLASSSRCAHQAFSVGANILGLQFHVEADPQNGLEPWLIGHAAELAGAKISPRALRAEAARLGPTLRHRAERLFQDWLAGLRV